MASGDFFFSPITRSPIFHIFIYGSISSEPFFYSRLFAVEEIDRRGPASSESSARASLVGEADRVKYLMHMHSFTYDFHVRTAKAFLESRWEALSHLPLLRLEPHMNKREVVCHCYDKPTTTYY